MTTTVFQTLRESLNISIEHFAARSNLCVSDLIKIEQGLKEPTESFVIAYANLLHINKFIVRILLVGTKKRLPFFEKLRNSFLKFLNGYLKAAIWMTNLDESNKKIPH